MKFLVIILSILSAFFANLEKKTLQSDFVVAVDEGQQGMAHYPGSVTMKGKLFTLTAAGIHAAYDGQTMYSYSEETEELTLTNPTEEELAESNPLLFAKAVADVCTVTEKANKDGSQTIITLVPEDAEQVGVDRFVLKVRNSDLMLLQLEVKEGKKVTTLKLNNPKWVSEKPTFTIEPDETTFVNDLRF